MEVLSTRKVQNKKFEQLKSLTNFGKHSAVSPVACRALAGPYCSARVLSVFYLAHYSRIPVHWYAIHSVCWGIPIILTCIAMGFTHVGRLDSFPELETCSYYGALAAEIYHIIFYYGLILTIFAVMLYMQHRIRQLEKRNDPRVFNATFIITKTSLYLYPSLLIVCWLPHVVLAIIQLSMALTL
jgi:hypothetical protein